MDTAFGEKATGAVLPSGNDWVKAISGTEWACGHEGSSL